MISAVDSSVILDVVTDDPLSGAGVREGASWPITCATISRISPSWTPRCSGARPTPGPAGQSGRIVTLPPAITCITRSYPSSSAIPTKGSTSAASAEIRRGRPSHTTVAS